MESANKMRIPLTVVDSAIAQFNYTYVLLFVCGFHKVFWTRQKLLRIPQIGLFLERF